MREERVHDVDGIAAREWGEPGVLAAGRLGGHRVLAEAGPQVAELVADWLDA